MMKQTSELALRRRATRTLPPVGSLFSYDRSASSSSSSGPSWHRRTLARATLTAQEWRERCVEWRDSIGLRTQGARTNNFTADSFVERTHIRWIDANRRFDDWFNAQWPIWQEQAQQRLKQLREGSKQEKMSQTLNVPKTNLNAPVNVPALLLLGAGVGSATQGYIALSMFAIFSGAAHGVIRFVQHKVEVEDREGLFRYCPYKLSPLRQAEIFNKLQYEMYVSRKIREGDKRFFSWNQPKPHKAMDPLNDYTPETLFEDTMKSLVVHPRVLETLGGNINHVEEPDKVVYRIVEGVAEVYLAWHIAGPTTGAEVQVKAAACLLDYIYVFPEPIGRYQVTPQAFVIRPKSSTSQNVEDLPRYQKSPFGAKGDSERLYVNRQGVFEMDWEVRDFKHGKEDRQGWR